MPMRSFRAASSNMGRSASAVFAPTGEASLQLVLSGLPRDLSARDIDLYAERLRATAAVITNAKHDEGLGHV